MAKANFEKIYVKEKHLKSEEIQTQFQQNQKSTPQSTKFFEGNGTSFS